jgi:hypothetical protein
MSVSDFACTEEAVLAMRKQGMGKEKIIRAVWNASKGGGPAYQEASRKYDAIVAALAERKPA